MLTAPGRLLLLLQVKAPKMMTFLDVDYGCFIGVGEFKCAAPSSLAFLLPIGKAGCEGRGFRSV